MQLFVVSMKLKKKKMVAFTKQKGASYFSLNKKYEYSFYE